MPGGHADQQSPDPRGSLPVPVSLVYTGSARAGAAGAGWDVPLTYVRRQVSTWRRRPRYFNVPRATSVSGCDQGERWNAYE